MLIYWSVRYPLINANCYGQAGSYIVLIFADSINVTFSILNASGGTSSAAVPISWDAKRGMSFLYEKTRIRKRGDKAYHLLMLHNVSIDLSLVDIITADKNSTISILYSPSKTTSCCIIKNDITNIINPKYLYVVFLLL